MPLDDNLATLFEAVADTAADYPAIVQGETTRTWSELDDRAARVARRLSDKGIGRGQRVGIGLRNGPEYIETVLAVMKLRAVPVNVNYRYQERELRELFTDSGASAVVFDASLTGRIPGALPALDEVRALVRMGRPEGADPLAGAADDYAEAATSAPTMPRTERSGSDEWLMFTGGTTGRPKGVLSQHRGLVSSALANGYDAIGIEAPRDADQLRERTRAMLAHERRMTTLVAPPLMHATGLYTALGTLLTAGTVVFPTTSSYDPQDLARTLEQRRVTDLCIVGDAFGRPLADVLDAAAAAGRPFDLRALRRIVSVGVLWSAEVKQRLLAHCDAVLHDVIAASEGGPFAMSQTTRDEQAVTSRFVLLPGARVIAEDDTHVVPGSGQVGHLAAPSAQEVGYLGDTDATAATFRTIDGQRYCIPGDLARIESDGSLTLLGRGGRVINTGGEKVFAEEVEQVVAQHPDVRDVNVVGVPDETWGQRIVAVVAPRPEVQLRAGEISDYVASRLARYKRPRGVAFVDEVRRSPTGKLDLAWARETARRAEPV